MLAGTVLVATDDGGAIDGAVDGTLLGVADALAALGVQQMSGRQVAGADGGIGLQRNTDQAELQQAGPTGPAIRRRRGERQGFGGVVREIIGDGKVSEKREACVAWVPP